MYKIVLAVTMAAVACSTAQAQPVGLDFYDDLAALPFVYDNVQSYYLSSYDRTGGNDDGFRGTYSQLYVQDNGEHVIFDQDGPGCIYNFWFTGDDQRLHWGKIRIYVDGQETSAFESPDEKLFLGESAPFVEPLVTDSFVSSGGFSCSAPIPFQKHLKITTEKTVGFYNIYYQLYKDVDVKSWTPRQDYSSLIRLFERCGSDPKRVSEPLSVQRQLVALDKAAGRDVPERATCGARSSWHDSIHQDQPAVQAGCLQSQSHTPAYFLRWRGNARTRRAARAILRIRVGGSGRAQHVRRHVQFRNLLLLLAHALPQSHSHYACRTGAMRREVNFTARLATRGSYLKGSPGRWGTSEQHIAKRGPSRKPRTICCSTTRAAVLLWVRS